MFTVDSLKNVKALCDIFWFNAVLAWILLTPKVFKEQGTYVFNPSIYIHLKIGNIGKKWK